MFSAGQQHGSVYWSQDSEHALQNLPESKVLEAKLHHTFSSPNWQAASTTSQCELFDRQLRVEFQSAIHNGRKAHHVRPFCISDPQTNAPCSSGSGVLGTARHRRIDPPFVSVL